MMYVIVRGKATDKEVLRGECIDLDDAIIEMSCLTGMSTSAVTDTYSFELRDIL
jgi:hypothetical protein